MRELFSETEYYIGEFRALIPTSSHTARAIDNKEPWTQIAILAQQEGYTSFASYLTHANLNWAAQTHTGQLGTHLAADNHYAGD